MLSQVCALQIELDVQTVICAGDIFDDGWRPHKCPPELINFAIRHLPNMYAVPGQHDLPHHNYSDIKRSGYWTLVEAGTIIDLPPKEVIRTLNGIYLHGFPWGSEITPLEPDRGSKDLHVAVIHSYVWLGGHSFPGVKEEQSVDGHYPRIRGYDAAVFGDNHKGFLQSGDLVNPNVLNCGTLMRRRSDEETYEPKVGVLYSDGTIRRRALNTDSEVFNKVVDPVGVKELGLDVDDFVQFLKDIGDKVLDFNFAVRHYCEKQGVGDAVKKIITKAMG